MHVFGDTGEPNLFAVKIKEAVEHTEPLARMYRANLLRIQIHLQADILHVPSKQSDLEAAHDSDNGGLMVRVLVLNLGLEC